MIIRVNAGGGYDVVVGSGGLSQTGEIMRLRLGANKKAFVITDSVVAANNAEKEKLN